MQLVIPRDFFNHSKLLKCLGQLSLKVLDNKLIKFKFEEYIGDGLEDVEHFQIELYEQNNMLRCDNYYFVCHDRFIYFGIPYNSKGPYPLLAFVGDEECGVFDDSGEFTQEFIDLLDQITQEENS